MINIPFPSALTQKRMSFSAQSDVIRAALIMAEAPCYELDSRDAARRQNSLRQNEKRHHFWCQKTALGISSFPYSFNARA